jgi:hypothetical protein
MPQQHISPSYKKYKLSRRTVSLTSINVDPQNLYYSSLNGVLFDKTQSTLVEFPSGLGGSYSIPEGVVKIGPMAFDSVGEYPFVSIPPLTNIVIPTSVTEIGAGAFQGVSHNMFSLTIPASVTIIGDQAFQYSGLTNLYFEGDAPNVGQEDFYLESLTTVYYLPGATGGVNITFTTCLIYNLSLVGLIT